MSPNWGRPDQTGNNAGSLLDNTPSKALWLLNNLARAGIVWNMKHILLCGLLAVMFTATSAHAECYADYKAKQDNPLRLHYGVLEVRGACDAGNASREANARLRSTGWTLLNIVSVFGPEGLQSRKASAGQFFLRF